MNKVKLSLGRYSSNMGPDTWRLQVFNERHDCIMVVDMNDQQFS